MLLKLQGLYRGFNKPLLRGSAGKLLKAFVFSDLDDTFLARLL